MSGGYIIEVPRRAGDELVGARAGDVPVFPPAFLHSALRVWSDEPVIPLGAHGCIIGHLFTRELPSRRVWQIDPADAALVIASEGQSLISSHWGGYVLALVAEDGRPIVMRDPSGLMPCYFRRDVRAVKFSSDLTDVAGRGEASVDSMELARYLLSADAPGSTTCVAGAEELIPGQALILKMGMIDLETLWSPWDHVEPKDMTAAEAADALRRVALDCIGTWASCFESVLLGVSGGLDSSIVAAGSCGHTSLSCLTHVGPDSEGDERVYARALTDHLGVALAEAHYDLADIDIARAVAPHHPSPNAHHFRQAIEAMHRRAGAAAVDAIFSGNGGDGIFCGMRSATPLVDRYLMEGPNHALVTTLRDLSDLTGADAWKVLRYAWRKYRARKEAAKLSVNTAGLAPDRLAPILAAGPRHPWNSASPFALPGKRAHVAFLVRSLRSLELYPRRTSPPHIAPLLSQPLVELCLSIPSWHWISGGSDRSIARAAFDALLPDAVLRRAHKGGPSGFTRLIYERCGAEALKLLRDGSLHRAKILDPAFLEISDDPSWLSSERPDRVLAFVAAETWTRWWQGDDVSGRGYSATGT